MFLIISYENQHGHGTGYLDHVVFSSEDRNNLETGKSFFNRVNLVPEF